MKNGTKSPDDKRRKTKKQKEANDNTPMAKSPVSEAKTVSEAKPVMRVQSAAPMPQPKPAVTAKPAKTAPAPKAAAKVKTAVKAAPKAAPKSASKSNDKSKKDTKKDVKKASKPARPRPFETISLMSAFKPPFAVASFAMPKAMMPLSLAEAGQDALAVNRKLVEMTQDNMRSGLDFAMRLAGAKTPMEFMSLQMSYWQERMGTFARQAKELRELAGGSGR